MNKVAYFKSGMAAATSIRMDAGPPYAEVPDIRTFFGGKGGSGVYQAIINQTPPHITYVAGFLGHDALLRMKRPAQSNIGIDISSKVVSAWKKARLHSSLNLTILEGDFLAMNPNIWGESTTFLYLDPPYPMSTRKSRRDRYDYELTNMEHARLLGKIVEASCMVAISSYPNSLYDDCLSGWRYIDFQAQTRHGVATERLYMNYDEPEELHDYSYLGTDYKDRERIKLKFDRWVANFEALPVQEQNMRIDYLNSTKFKTA